MPFCLSFYDELFEQAPQLKPLFDNTNIPKQSEKLYGSLVLLVENIRDPEWDTEAYCIPFYMATKNQKVARNLLTYRYLQLDRAIENAGKLGFTKGAALYPMVTMNGEECHNEWEITFEEIHRNMEAGSNNFNSVTIEFFG